MKAEAEGTRDAGSRSVKTRVAVPVVFNSDAIDDYNDEYILPENLAPGEANPWGTPDSLVNPRFAQFSLQFNF